MRASQRARGEDVALVDALLSADERRRSSGVRFDELRAEQTRLEELFFNLTESVVDRNRGPSPGAGPQEGAGPTEPATATGHLPPPTEPPAGTPPSDEEGAR